MVKLKINWMEVRKCARKEQVGLGDLNLAKAC